MSETTNTTTTPEELNDDIVEEIDDATVVTVPIDDTLSISGEAADAKAVGAALAEKADRSELQTQVKVNGQSADAQGLIILLASHIPMDASATPTYVSGEIAGLKAKTGAARLALAHPQVPVIPVAHWGNERLFDPWTARPNLRLFGRRTTTAMSSSSCRGGN